MFTTFNAKIQLKWPKVGKLYNPLDELALAEEGFPGSTPQQIAIRNLLNSPSCLLARGE
jgi:hypothetical protein